MDLKVLDQFEVYSSKTTEYIIELNQTLYTIRIAEDSNGIDYLIKTKESLCKDNWQDLYEDSHGEVGNTILDLILDGCIK